MKLAVDSSSLAKRYVQEFGSDKMDYLLQRTAEGTFLNLSTYDYNVPA